MTASMISQFCPDPSKTCFEGFSGGFLGSSRGLLSDLKWCPPLAAVVATLVDAVIVFILAALLEIAVKIISQSIISGRVYNKPAASDPLVKFALLLAYSRPGAITADKVVEDKEVVPLTSLEPGLESAESVDLPGIRKYSDSSVLSPLALLFPSPAPYWQQ